MYYFEKTENFSELRNQYFDSLIEPQELFLELMIPNAEKLLIISNKEEIGYFIKIENRLIEFYLLNKYLPECSVIFRKIIDDFKLGAAYCKSFDHVLLKACMHHLKTVNIIGVFIFKNQGSLIGFGIFQPAVEGRSSYDIGMAVAPTYRKKGYGAFILNHLKTHCLKNNWRPTCGCAIENIASQKTIEKIGYVSKYNMLEFSF